VLRASAIWRRAPSASRPAEDIAQLVGKDTDEVRRLLSRSEHTASLDAPLDVDPLLSIGRVDRRREQHEPGAAAARGEIESLVREWILQLNDKQRP